MNLIVDIGNTYIKIFIYLNDKVIEQKQFSYINEKEIYYVIKSYIADNNVNKIIFSSVIGYDEILVDELKKIGKFVITLDQNTKIPIKNNYKTPETLGNDRIAAVVGGNYIYPFQNLLIIDAGTAITFDFINSDNEYVGGNISVGLNTRFKALNTFTKKLPLLKGQDLQGLIGSNTDEAIILGVQNGLIYEINGYISHFQDLYSDLKIILTGGDCFFFEKILKNNIFVFPNLVSTGLNRILKYNE
jgi:type III pantothenate kinase